MGFQDQIAQKPPEKIESFGRLIELAVSNDKDVYEKICFTGFFSNDNGSYVIPTSNLLGADCSNKFYGNFNAKQKDIDTLKDRLSDSSPCLNSELKDFIHKAIASHYPSMNDELIKENKQSKYSVNIDGPILNTSICAGLYVAVALVCIFAIGMNPAGAAYTVPFVGSALSFGYLGPGKKYIKENYLKESKGMIIGNKITPPKQHIEFNKSNTLLHEDTIKERTSNLKTTLNARQQQGNRDNNDQYPKPG